MDVQSRIDRLEKERWLYLGIAGLGALAGLIAVVISLVNSKSGSGPLLLSGTDGDAIVMHDKQGAPRATLGFKDGQPTLRFIDKNRKVRESLGLSAEGEPQLVMNSDSEKKRAEIFVTNLGMPSLIFYDAASNPRQRLSIATLGSSLEFLDANYKPAITLKDENGAKFELFDTTGKKVFTAP